MIFNKLFPWALVKQPNPIYSKLKRTTFLLLIYSSIVVLAEIFFNHFLDILQIDNLGQFHLIFNFVIAILIAFRLNTAYARWWEARGYWGQLVNNSRNLALKFNTYIGLNNDPRFLNIIISLPNLFKHYLRNEIDQCQEIVGKLGLKIDLTIKSNLPTLLIDELYQIINNYRNKNQISFEQYLSIDQHIVNITDLVGGCEKIASTPLPSAVKIFVRRSLIFYMIVFPFGWVDKFGVLIIPMIIVIVDILLGLELLSEALEDPFAINYLDPANNENSLNLDLIAEQIVNNIQVIANKY